MFFLSCSKFGVVYLSNRMEVFTINLTLNIMLPLVILTHVTIRNFESVDSSILNLLHTNDPVCDFKISIQSFRSSAVVDLIAAT